MLHQPWRKRGGGGGHGKDEYAAPILSKYALVRWSFYVRTGKLKQVRGGGMNEKLKYYQSMFRCIGKCMVQHHCL